VSHRAAPSRPSDNTNVEENDGMEKRVAWGRVPRNFHFARDGLILEKPKYYIKIPFIPHSINNKHQMVNIVWGNSSIYCCSTQTGCERYGRGFCSESEWSAE